jgi:hypothetical protein
MIHRGCFSVLAVPALMTGLFFAQVGRADNKPKPHTAPMSKKAPPVNATLRFEEARTLRQAFILLAAANHDYNGHRVKAMASVRDALHILDDPVMKHGTPQMKAATKEENVAVARAAAADPRKATVHEPQGASDGQLRKAQALLVEARATMAKNKQSKVLGHVDAAIKEIAIALQIR